jgi:hypothetical protein
MAAEANGLEAGRVPPLDFDDVPREHFHLPELGVDPLESSQVQRNLPGHVLGVPRHARVKWSARR